MNDRDEDPNPLRTFFGVLVTLYFLVSGAIIGLCLIVLFVALMLHK